MGEEKKKHAQRERESAPNTHTRILKEAQQQQQKKQQQEQRRSCSGWQRRHPL